MNMLRELRFRFGSARHARDLHRRIDSLEGENEELYSLAESLKSDLNSRDKIIEYQRSVYFQNSEDKHINPENITWVFGTARTGSTWIADMLCHRVGCRMWREPFIGLLFGNMLYERARSWQPESKQFVLGQPWDKWLPHVRDMIIDGAYAATSVDPNGHAIVKEPNGSIGSPILLEAVPESRVIVMLRDPRDVVASTLDAELGDWIDPDSSRSIPQAEDIVLERSRKYLKYMQKSLEAYESHNGPKTLVYYEHLRYDTMNVLSRAVTELGLPHSEQNISEAVHKTAWENLDDSRKGSGKFHRKATPGDWQNDLTSDQIKTVEEITASLMDRFGYERVS